METQTALIRTDGAVELHAVTDVHLHLTLVVHPGHTECRDALGLNDALDDLCLLKFGMLVVHVLDGLQHFSHCLQKLHFTGVFLLQALHDFLYVHSKSL